jgi:hypothetical protein
MAALLGPPDVVKCFVASLLPCRRTCAPDWGGESQGHALGLEGQNILSVQLGNGRVSSPYHGSVGSHRVAAALQPGRRAAQAAEHRNAQVFRLLTYAILRTVFVE